MTKIAKYIGNFINCCIAAVLFTALIVFLAVIAVIAAVLLPLLCAVFVNALLIWILICCAIDGISLKEALEKIADELNK